MTWTAGARAVPGHPATSRQTPGPLVVFLVLKRIDVEVVDSRARGDWAVSVLIPQVRPPARDLPSVALQAAPIALVIRPSSFGSWSKLAYSTAYFLGTLNLVSFIGLALLKLCGAGVRFIFIHCAKLLRPWWNILTRSNNIFVAVSLEEQNR